MITKISNQLPITFHSVKNVTRPNKSNETQSNNSINSSNINNLNYYNKSLISFKGASFYQTINDNYFQLPIDKTSGKPFQADVYQKAAAENLYKGNDVLVTAPTGTGKTAIAHYVINKNLEDGKKTFYTTPLKALSNDKVREFQKIYGKENVGLITGDKKVNKDAPIVIMTTEVYRNMVIQNQLKERNPILDNVKTVVFDELHYLGDNDRGSVWEQAIMFTPKNKQLLSLSGTMANPEEITDWMAKTKGHKVSEKVTPDNRYHARNQEVHTVLINVPSKNRHVPLDYEVIDVKPEAKRSSGAGSKADKKRARKQANQFAQSDGATPSKDSYVDMVEKLQREDKLPAIFFIFSKREGRGALSYLKDNAPQLTNKKEERQIEQTLQRYKDEGKYIGESMDMVALKKGYALHNAGMLPEQKELVEELFQKKLLKTVISTETLSAGINMPARTTVITGVRKPTDNPDGDDHKRYIYPNEFHQMAGRAGRRGIDTQGYCISMAVNKSQHKKFDELISSPSNDIESHYKIDYSFVASIDDSYNDKGYVHKLLKDSLKAYNQDPKVSKENSDKMIKEFENKESILKNYDYLDKDKRLTDKGQLLKKLNGYEQIPVIDSIVNKEFEGMNAIQLAGVVAGLANMENVPKDDNNFPKKEEDFYDDEVVEEFETNMSEKIADYNKNIYNKYEGREIKNNSKAIKHVFAWADMNSKEEDSKKNWKDLYSGDMKKSIKDEGSLFREIMQTNDLLKQMKEVSLEGESLAEKPRDKKYYQNLQDTIDEAIELINRPPAQNDEIEEE
jgi:superfamily II RNA helicase